MKTLTINKKEAKKEVEKNLHHYRNVKEKINMTGYIPQSSHHLTPQKRNELKFVKKVSESLNQLEEDQYLLIKYRYLENNGRTFDYIVRNKIAVSERTYYRIKNDALLKLYDLLNL